MTTTEPNTYTARFRRDAEGMWLAELAEVPQVHTYGRSLEKTREHLRDAARLWFNDGRVINLHEVLDLPGVTSSINRAVTGRRRAETATSEAAAATSDAVRRLAEAGITIRDTADILDLSPQRIHQLLNQPAS